MNKPAQVKTCSKCKDEKKVFEFSKNKSKKDGLASFCKECQKEWRNNNKKILSERWKKYYNSHKSAVLEYSKNHYKNNKEKYKDNHAEYYENNKESCSNRGHQNYLKNRTKVLLNTHDRRILAQNNPEFVDKPLFWLYKRSFENARKREKGGRLLPFNVSFQEFQKMYSSGYCVRTGDKLYCTRVAVQAAGNHNASFDRINSLDSYYPDNCQWVTNIYNRCKQDLSDDEFYELCLKVVNYRQQALEILSKRQASFQNHPSLPEQLPDPVSEC